MNLAMVKALINSAIANGGGSAAKAIELSGPNDIPFLEPGLYITDSDVYIDYTDFAGNHSMTLRGLFRVYHGHGYAEGNGTVYAYDVGQYVDFYVGEADSFHGIQSIDGNGPEQYNDLEDRIASIQNRVESLENNLNVYRIGNGEPNSELGNNGDIYLKV